MNGDARHLGIGTGVPLAHAYASGQRPENFPRWAAGLSTSLRRDGDRRVADTLQGPAIVTFSPLNDFGILDHHALMEGQADIYIPLRMIAHGAGRQVIFTLLRQPDMDDAQFEADAQVVMADLRRLKTVLEDAAAG